MSKRAAAHALEPLFNPRSLAVIGASEKSAWTSTMRECLRRYGFEGPVYAVNRSGNSVFGWPGFTSCAAIGEPVDAVYVCVPNERVPGALDDAGRAGIRAAVVLSSGFAETGPAGAAAQRELAERAERLGIHLLGPNCLGFANIAARSAITGIPPRGELLADGHVGIVCQSGAAAAEILEFTQLQGVGVNFLAATGNEACIGIADVVDYLVDEDATRVITVFAESIRDSARFAAAAGRALAAAKPLIVLKVGASELAARVALAHTASEVGDDVAFGAACAELGVIRVHSIEDMVITASLLAQTGALAEGGVGVVSVSGGSCTLIADGALAAGMPLPVFSDTSVEALADVLPEYATVMNPLDVTGAFVRDPAILERSLAILGEDPGIALRFCSINLPWQQGLVTPTPPMLDAVGAGLSGGQSPGLLVVQTLKPITDLSRELMKRHRIPGVIGGLDHAVRAAARACWWSARYRACTAST